jgi:HEAT repeat protein
VARAVIVVGGFACLFLAALLIERPFAGAPENAVDSGQPRIDAGADSLAASLNSPVVKTAEPAPDDIPIKDQWLNKLMQLEFTPFDQSAPIIARALQNSDREVRLRAVNLLIAAKDNPEILPLLATAQSDPDAEVRRDAIVALANSPLQENLTPYLLRGASDMDGDVRESLLQTAWSLAPAQRDDFVAQSLNSSRPEIASAAFQMLAHESSARTVSLLLDVYATNDLARIQQANDVMNGLVGQTFDNAAQASSWWRDHQAEYNDDLSPKTDDASANL